METKSKDTPIDYLKRKRASLIREQRKKLNLTQKEVAKKLGMSRPTYIALEQGKKEMTISKAKKLSGILGVSTEDLIECTIPDREKYIQMVFAFLRSQASPDRKIPKTMLAKLLYLADFAWYYKNLESMSKMRYRKIQFGPVANEYFEIIDQLAMDNKLIIQNTGGGAMLISETEGGQEQPLNLLKDEELKLIQAIAQKWRGKKTSDIVAFTHGQLPYKFGFDGEVISYELFTQEDPGNVY